MRRDRWVCSFASRVLRRWDSAFPRVVATERARTLGTSHGTEGALTVGGIGTTNGKEDLVAIFFAVQAG